MRAFPKARSSSDSLWHKMFGGDPNVLGTSFRLDTDLYTIVGVMPPDFRHPARTLGHDVEVWIACGFAAAPVSKASGAHAAIYPGRHRAREFRTEFAPGAS